MLRALLLGLPVLFAASPAFAAETAHGVDGTRLSLLWMTPFAGILLSIAILPLVARHFWHNHYGKVALFWSLALLLPFWAIHGGQTAAYALGHALLDEYLPFIVLLFALYTIAGGILVTGRIRGTPGANTALLTVGTLMASFVGTTGAAMILIRPLLRAIELRQNKAHIIVFFIILVANVGGALTPLGDPPLFVGFLRGVDFFWTAQHLWMQTILLASAVIAIFYAVDAHLYRSEGPVAAAATSDTPPRIRVFGSVNFILLGAVIALILMSAWWQPNLAFEVVGARLALQEILRDGSLILLAVASLWLTPNEHRASNGFSWEPIREVAILFAGIFVAIIPVVAMLQAGRAGPFAWLLQAVTYDDGAPHEVAYFWLTGVLSALLDNAPTYLVFFELAGGDPERLMGPLAGTLAGISMGAVYMGALTYIGNAPNFMIYAIATEHKINMPSFFGYLLWSSIVLMPLFVILTFLPFAPMFRSP